MKSLRPRVTVCSARPVAVTLIFMRSSMVWRTSASQRANSGLHRPVLISVRVARGGPCARQAVSATKTGPERA